MSTPNPNEITIRPIAAQHTYLLRHRLLWPDKPMSYVILDEDATGKHFGAFLGTPAPNTTPNAYEITATSTSNNNKPFEQLIGIISLYIAPTTHGPEARFRKFAMLPEFQGKGIGSMLLQHVIEVAREMGVRGIWCDARESARGFYERFGMMKEGEGFFKGEIPYVKMRREFDETTQGR